jgi:hypothetical protein
MVQPRWVIETPMDKVRVLAAHPSNLPNATRGSISRLRKLK